MSTLNILNLAITVAASSRDLANHSGNGCGGDGWEKLRIELTATRTVIAELIEADTEYDSAIHDLRELNRKIAEQGWLELEFDALRNAGMRLVKAQERRRVALLAVQGGGQ